MGTESIHRVARRHDIPKAIRALDVLPSHYLDITTETVNPALEASPERWARASLEDASAVGRSVAWRALLNLRLKSGLSSDHVAGWKIVDRGAKWIRLEASSWFMTANIVFHEEDGQVSFATYIRYDNPIAKIVWTPVSVIHRRLAPDVLRAGVRRVERSS